MPREYRILSMDRKDPQIVVEGMEVVLERDLTKHQKAVQQAELELGEYRAARILERNKKSHYESLLGGGKFNDTALKNGIAQIDINIRQLSDKIKLSSEKIEHHTEIVRRLQEELKQQYAGLKVLRGK